MKNTTNGTKVTGPPQVTRREFVGGALAAGVVTAAPAFLRGRNLNDKLDIAFIACGGRATASLSELTVAAGGAGSAAPAASHPDENVVVLCDVNQLAVDEAAQRFPKARTYNDLSRRPNTPTRSRPTWP